jgi:hypothetical protein
MTGQAQRQIDEWLEQAAAFARGGDYTGALARAQYARDQLSRSTDLELTDQASFEDLRGRTDLEVERYERLLREWQAENMARRAAYLVREERAIGADRLQPVRAGRWRRMMARRRATRALSRVAQESLVDRS